MVILRLSTRSRDKPLPSGHQKEMGAGSIRRDRPIRARNSADEMKDAVDPVHTTDEDDATATRGQHKAHTQGEETRISSGTVTSQLSHMNTRDRHQSHMIQATGPSRIGGCCITVINADGRINSNGMGVYLEMLRDMAADILIILDTRLNDAESQAQVKDIHKTHPGYGVQAIPTGASTKCSTEYVAGGIMIIANADWSRCIGALHQDDSKLGLVAKFKLRTKYTTFVVIPTYLPPTTARKDIIANQQRYDNTAMGRLTTWLRQKNIRGTPIDWLLDMVRKWITVAQTNEENPIVLGDFNATDHPTEAGGYGSYGPLQKLTHGWQLRSVTDRLLPHPHFTYWVGDTGRSNIDHILINEETFSLVASAQIGISPKYVTTMLHKWELPSGFSQGAGAYLHFQSHRQ